jgi:hypothetical protein
MDIDKAMKNYLRDKSTRDEERLLLDYSLKALNSLIEKSREIRIEGR